MEQSKFYQIKNITEQEYTLVGCDGSVITRPIHDVDKSASVFTIQDAKDGDVLATSAGAFIYNGNNGGGSCLGSYCGINTLGGFKTGVKHHWTGKKVYPATKEQRDLLFQKMKEAGYEWDAEKKELKNIVDEEQIKKNLQDNSFRRMFEQKSAWSEEDEAKLKSILFHIEDVENKDVINWFKSLKDRVQPKQEWSDDFEEEMDRYIEENFYGSADCGFFSNRTKRELEAEDVVRIGCHFAIWQKEHLKKSFNKPKQEWSEEDETVLDNLIYALANDRIDNNRDEYINWLKSLRSQPKQEMAKRDKDMIRFIGNAITCDDASEYLKEKGVDVIDAHVWLEGFRPQSQWKPSDEQMGVIEAVINNRSFQRRHLDSLYEQLKKLKD